MPREATAADHARALPPELASEGTVTGTTAGESLPDLSPETVRSSTPFVGRWNDLVSTTNWEKGRIIGDWRAALEATTAAVTEYSDEAWARLVGGVTSQHVGRLRRVHARFGDACDQYPGLYWSHFQAALDWSDAEMWLEGAITNGWSVSQMRGARWEAVGAPDGVKPTEDEIFSGEIDEDAGSALDSSPSATAFEDAPFDTDDDSTAVAERDADSSDERSSTSTGAAYEEGPVAEATPRVRPFANVAELPDDVADAFEQFKLAILAHKLTDWEAISRESLLGALDALRTLALAPSNND
ncbi:hypothetical protein [Botrimarina hoheduenensis]|uniref:Uncharacterized protein n=1 Tax=Botrimarina hoheduenensis TaxID=2528000 RepID=A0A5C5W767_9BACT|nr:hypothetical protein [Botrimarina hoheduenensis]TWT46708.1 hypothetical protein Pla111_18090 [Botrimarina hoheduenensis]